LCRCQKT
jgi:hypothetical protein